MARTINLESQIKKNLMLKATNEALGINASKPGNTANDVAEKFEVLDKHGIKESNRLLYRYWLSTRLGRTYFKYQGECRIKT